MSTRAVFVVSLFLAACGTDRGDAPVTPRPDATVVEWVPNPPPADAGTVLADSGSTEPDAGSIEPDGGTTIIDASTPPIDLRQAITDIVSPHVDTGGVTRKAIGFIVRVEAPDRSETFTFGSDTKGMNRAPNPDASWVIGSVSKVFTAYLVASSGIPLDDPATAHLPGNWSGADGRIKVSHLLTHTAGLPRYPQLLDAAIRQARSISSMFAAWESYSVEDLRTDFVAQDPATNPGTAYLYSDFGFGVAQQIAEHQSGQSYASLLASMRASLDLPNTIMPEALQPGTPYLPGHIGPQFTVAPRPLITDAFVGDGYIISNARDLGRMMRVFARMEPASAAVETAVAAMEVGRFERSGMNGLTVQQGLALGVCDDGQNKLYKKNGSAVGNVTTVIYDPETKIAVVMGANSAAEMGMALNDSGCRIAALVAATRGVTYSEELLNKCRLGF